MTTPASPSPGTQLLSEEELKTAELDLISEARDWPEGVKLVHRVFGHIAALAAENAATKERVAGYETELASWRRTAERLKELNNALTASREEMREALEPFSELRRLLTDYDLMRAGVANGDFDRARALAQQTEKEG